MKIAGISRKQRRVIIYDENNYFDGNDYFDTDKEDIKKWSFTNSYKSKIIPIKKDDDKALKNVLRNSSIRLIYSEKWLWG